MIICPICQKPIRATESFSCAVCGEDSEGKLEVEKQHLACMRLTDYQKENFYENKR